MILAIDGPAASGKSTVAKAAARRLGFAYLDTGAMYRAVAALALHLGRDLEDADVLTDVATDNVIEFSRRPDDPVQTGVSIAGLDVTEAIRTPQVDAAVSLVARVPGVREAMVAQQRAAVKGMDAVLEGRDIGTVVFPDAEVKVFLTATPEERARRRHEEQSDAGHTVDAEGVLKGLHKRDEADSKRKASPLIPAADAVEVDTTGLSIEQVVERIVTLVEERR